MTNLIKGLSAIGLEAIDLESNMILVHDKTGLKLVISASHSLDDACKTLKRYGMNFDSPDISKLQQLEDSVPLIETKPLSDDIDKPKNEVNKYKLKELPRGWYDVIDVETGNPVNAKRLREADAKALINGKEANA